MHESSIAINILDIAEQECGKHGCTVVDSVCVRIGNASGIMAESLNFVYDIIKDGYLTAKNSRLLIEIVPLAGTCKDCKQEFEAHDTLYVFNCPLCGSASFEITRGREMEIAEMEIH
ncbi:MAG: hydrogenase maturation nickel metallochaperone HypA [Pseudomonadota bacterium]